MTTTQTDFDAQARAAWDAEIHAGRFDELFARVDQVRNLAGKLPPPVASALAAVQAAKRARTSATRTAEDVRRTAVDALTAGLLAGQPVDPFEAARAVTVARWADDEAASAAEITAAAAQVVQSRAVQVIRQHGAQLVTDHLRPVAEKAFDGIAAHASELPPGIDAERRRGIGRDIAGQLADLDELIGKVASCYQLRAALITEGVLAKSAVDVGGLFLVVRDMDEHEDSRLMSGDWSATFAGEAGVKSTLPPRGSTAWWLFLARAGADFWFPTPVEQDQRAVDYFAERQRNSDGRGPVVTLSRPLAAL